MNPFHKRFIREMKEAYMEALEFLEDSKANPDNYTINRVNTNWGTKDCSKVRRGDKVLKLGVSERIKSFRNNGKTFEFFKSPFKDGASSAEGAISTFLNNGSAFILSTNVYASQMTLTGHDLDPFKVVEIFLDIKTGEVVKNEWNSEIFWNVYDLVFQEEKEFLLAKILPFIE